MKKLILILLAISLMGCLGSKKSSEKESVSSLRELLDKKTDSISKETINKGISDEAVFKIPESRSGDVDFDQRVNDAVTSILRSINFQKSSGDNSYLIRFNEKLNQLEAKIDLGETRNAETSSNKETVSEKDSKESTTESFKKVVTTLPWWVWVIAFFVFFEKIMNIVGILYPPAKGINSLGDLFTKPKRD